MRASGCSRRLSGSSLQLRDELVHLARREDECHDQAVVLQPLMAFAVHSEDPVMIRASPSTDTPGSTPYFGA
ncbi:hypothetical protein A6A29_40895 [Streptomyces sp. TSRI0281]|nr:hypothetical protein A6A29_40895 [Streptomyces sp. TSRI0281]